MKKVTLAWTLPLIFVACGRSVDVSKIDGFWMGKQQISLREDRKGDRVESTHDFSDDRAPLVIINNQSIQTPSVREGSVRFHIEENQYLVIQGERGDVKWEIFQLDESVLKLRRDIESANTRGSVTILYDRIDEDRMEQLRLRRQRNRNPNPAPTR